MVSLISDDNCCPFNNPYCGKPWILSYSCVPGIIYSLHRDAVRCVLQLSQDWTVPQGVNQLATESLSNWHGWPSSLVGRSNTPHRTWYSFSLSASQCKMEHALACWLGTKGGKPAAHYLCPHQLWQWDCAAGSRECGDVFGPLQNTNKGKKQDCLQPNMSWFIMELYLC